MENFSTKGQVYLAEGSKENTAVSRRVFLRSPEPKSTSRTHRVRVYG